MRLSRALSLLLLTGMLAACGPTSAPTATALPPTAIPTAAPLPTATSAPTAAPATPRPTTTPATTATSAPVVEVTPIPAGGRFAPYPKEEVTVRPAVSHPPIAPDLSNVRSAFLLSPEQRERLAQNGFVVSPGEEQEFYILYEKARYNLEPIFVTSDSLLHIYHLLFDKILRTIEREEFIPIARELNARMLQATAEQYQALKGTPLEESARRNVAFFAVGSRLLDPEVELPSYAADLAQAELDLVMAHDGMWPSPLFPGLPYGEDYTQYAPRGHYTMDENLSAYFRAWMWYGRMTFRVGDSARPDMREETQRALLIVQTMALHPEIGALWQQIYEPTVFFVGRSDDLLYTEYIGLMEEVYGGVPTDPLVFADEERLTALMEAAKDLRPPRILGMIVDVMMDEEVETKGFRFMGQRFIPDSYIHGLLIDDKVKGRFPPKGLDILAVLGSERAYALLEEEGDTAMPDYSEQMTRLQEEFATYTDEDWTQNLYWSWLYTFFPLLEEPGEGYPALMRSPAWLDKSINTVLGSWAELRHDTILYAKQAYAELGGGPTPPSPEPPKGYVEPVPEFYARLAALAAMTRQGLQARGLLDISSEETLHTLENLARRLKEIAEKELAGRPLSEEDYDLILYYGGTLEYLTFAAADTEDDAMPSTEEEPDAAVIADVATHPGMGLVLEVGVGRIDEIYVVVPIEGELVVAKGGVFAYYEFPWPMTDRLTDEKWREMLDSGAAPERPAWSTSFLLEETEAAALRQAVLDFNLAFVDAAWYVDTAYLLPVATGEALQTNTAHIEMLAENGWMEGHHLLGLEFLSYDLQDARQAIVTAQERWETERYTAYGKYGGEPDQLIARRPAYSIGVIYHLEQVEGQWRVSRVLLQGEVPAWEEITP